MPTANKARQPELSILVGRPMPRLYTRMFIEYLTDAQLIRLSFWLSNQRKGEIGTYRGQLAQQEFDQRGLRCPASWQKLPFDNEAQRAEWELWAALSTAKKKVFPIARTQPAKKRAKKKAR